MKATNLFRLMAMMLIGVATMGMTSCKQDELPAEDAWVLGKWYMEKEKHGTLGEGDTAVEYEKVVLSGWFEEGNKGFWALIYVDSTNRAINPDHAYAYYANCAYAVKDKTVAVKLTANHLPTSQMEWTLTYDGDCLETMFDNELVDLKRITTGQDAMFLEWMKQLGFGASADNYNINDVDFTQETWRDQEAIYIYDGVGNDVTDEKGRTGYTLVNLPWYEGEKLTNLPAGFCDDITPENGWEWVLNRCGTRNAVNNNFFAVYNKYMGILRFFYYLPQGGTSTGNDHVWQVSMTDNLAAHTTIPYGVPTDHRLVDKGAISRGTGGDYMEYVTPWVDFLSQDGLIVPNAGWWAFDVDMSLTRPEAVNGTDNIKVQMRSWNTSHTSLYSTMAANIDGDMKGTFEGKAPVTVNSGKGLFGKIKDFVGLKGTVTDVISSFSSGNYIGAIKGGISLAKSGVSIVNSGKSSTSGGGTIVEGTFGGTLNMMMSGTINTDGIISGSTPTVGISSPTFYIKDFDTNNTHFGQGVWNLKRSPEVYVALTLNNGNLLHDEDSGARRLANWMFFDPNSIEVELNPNVFPESDIEWIEVNPIAGVRSDMMWFATDPFRQAIGLTPCATPYYTSVALMDGDAYYHKLGDDLDNKVFDFARNDASEGLGLDDTNYPAVLPEMEDRYIFGRGYENYIIEPQASCYKGTYYGSEDTYANGLEFLNPAVEINVTLIVKLKTMEDPIILNRMYLPEFKYMDIYEPKPAWDMMERIKERKNITPQMEGHTFLYDYEVSRIDRCFRAFLSPINFDAKLIPMEYYWDNNKKFRFGFLFNENLNEKTRYVYGSTWYIPFFAKQPITPTGYTLTTASDFVEKQAFDKYPGSRIKDWVLKAKLNESDDWTVIATVNNDTTIQIVNSTSFDFPLDVTGGKWQYFQFETGIGGYQDFYFSELSLKY